MNFKAISAFLPFIVASGVLAQLSASPTSGTPQVTYPAGDAFVFCSAQGCTGTCEVVDASTVHDNNAEFAPNDMGFQSAYWYDPKHYYTLTGWTVYTVLNDASLGQPVEIGPNTCYNLYDNGVATDFYEYYYSYSVPAP